METLKKLTDLGFIAIFRISVDDTVKIMHRQVDGMPDLAVKVLDALRDWHAPNSVDKENHDEVLENWIQEQAEALHAETKPREMDWKQMPESQAASMARLIDRLDDYYGDRESHVQSTFLRATSLARVNGLELTHLTKKEKDSYFYHAVHHIAVENGIAVD